MERKLDINFKPKGDGWRTHASYSRKNFAFSRHGNLIATKDSTRMIRLWPRDMESFNTFDLTVNGTPVTFARVGTGGYKFESYLDVETYKKVVLDHEPRPLRKSDFMHLPYWIRKAFGFGD